MSQSKIEREREFWTGVILEEAIQIIAPIIVYLADMDNTQSQMILGAVLCTLFGLFAELRLIRSNSTTFVLARMVLLGISGAGTGMLSSDLHVPHAPQYSEKIIETVGLLKSAICTLLPAPAVLNLLDNNHPDM